MEVSVVIPCRDGRPHLAEAIRSALDQSFAVHEVIVVDDGSTDGSLDVARRFARHHPGRVVAVEGPWGGAAAARNQGASMSVGDALLFLDADDVMGRGALEALVAALRTRPGGVAIGPWYRLERCGGTWRQAPPSCPSRHAGEDGLSAWLRGWYHPPVSVLWSREALQRAGRWDEHCTHNQDGDLMMRALALGVPLAEAGTGAGYYRRHAEDGSISSGRFTREGLESRLRVVDKVVALLEDQGRSAAYRRPLGRAFRLIADDARAHPDLAAIAAAHARFHDPRRRVWRQLGPWTPRSRPTALRPGSGVDARLRTARRAPGPAVSIVIPTYNRGPLLARALDSVRAQTFGDFEVLVVDDGSTDDTAAIVDAYRDGRIRYLSQDRNQGVSAARNRGLREARGRLVAFLDSDDVWFPHKLALQVERFDALPQRVGLLYGAVEDVDGRGRSEIRTPSRRGDVYRDLLAGNVIHGCSNVVIRRAVVATIGFFDEAIPAIEDYDYWVRLARFYDIDFVDEPTMRYHDGAGAERRSLDGPANLTARDHLFRKHGAAMRRMGVAHLFLLESARRHLRHGDEDGGRSLAWRAVAAGPRSGAAWRLALRRTVPRPVRERVRRRRGRDRTGVGPRTEGLRILLYTSTSPTEAGGVQTVYRRLASDLRRRDHTVFETWADPGGPAADGVHPVRVPAVARRLVPLPVASTVVSSLWSAIRLAGALRRYRPDVVNVHFLYPPEVIHFVALRPFFGYRLVLSAHGSDVVAPSGPKARFLPRLASRADAVTAVSASVAEAIGAWSTVDPGRVHVITNSIDVGFWTDTTGRRPADDRGAAIPTILAVGRLEPVKGFDVLLEAFSTVRRHVPGCRLVVAGDGPARDDLARRTVQLGLGGSVQLAGRLDSIELRHQMHRAHCFALPSRREGMPLALLEAMAAGLATVSARVGGVPGMVDADAGLLVPPEDPEALAASLIAVLSDPDLRVELGRRARLRAVELAAGDRSAEYEALFVELTGRTA